MEKQVYERLQNALALIQRGWCQRDYAQDANGCSVRPNHESAVAWSVTGALAAQDTNSLVEWKEYQRARSMLSLHVSNGLPLSVWNDDPRRTQQDVVNAIESCLQS